MKTLQFDEAWQRCLDREMAPSEETAFLARLHEDERLDLHAIRLALGELERLPRVSAPTDLADKIMMAVRPKKQSAFTRLRRWLESRPMLGWELGGAALAASVLSVVLAPQFMLPVDGSSHASSTPTTTSGVPGRNGADGALQFSLYAPQARSVALIGDFNGWGSTAEVKLKPSANGVWSVSVPLSAGSYQYAFLLDGQRWVTDARAERHVSDDFGRQNAVITVM